MTTTQHSRLRLLVARDPNGPFVDIIGLSNERLFARRVCKTLEHPLMTVLVYPLQKARLACGMTFFRSWRHSL